MKTGAIVLSFFFVFFFARCEESNVVNHSSRSPDKPVQLVVPDSQHKKLILLEDNVAHLSKITGPVAVVSVVGKFHSGKSFLMNQLMKKPNGFGIGPSVQPKTMGIWMWGKPATMTLASGEKVSIIFLDTEGFAANNVSENYDAKIFAVATLLSSHLLYNSVKIIDQADIDYLEVLARRTQLFALHSQMSRSKWTNDLNENLLNFPPLIWVVQDFYQDTVDGETPQDWLRRLMLTHARESESYQISIMDIFKSVDCHPLFLPAVTRTLLNNLALAKESDLTEEYRKERDELIAKLKKQITPKQKANKPINGGELAVLLRILVNAANEGSLPDVPSLWDSFVERIQKTATEDCLKFYEEEFKMLMLDKGPNNPVKQSILGEWHKQTKQKSMDLLRHLLHGLEDTLEEGLKLLVNSIEVIHERNKDINDKKIKLKLVEIHNYIELSAEQTLAELDLPTSSEELNRHFHQLKKHLSEKFMNQIAEFVDVGGEKDYLQSVLKTIKIHTADTELRNNKKMQQLLENISNETVELFLKLSAEDYSPTIPRKPALLKKILDKALNSSIESYLHKTQKFAEEPMYPAQVSLLNEKLTGKRKESETENENLATRYLTTQAQKYLDLFVDRTGSTNIQLPVNDSDLETRLKLETSKIMRTYEQSLGDYVEYASYLSVLHQLKEDIAKVCRKRKNENIQAFAKEVHRPLENAKKLILLSADKYSTVFSFKKFIREVCLLNLDEGKPKLWPLELKSQIIENFVETNDEIKEHILAKEGIVSRIIGWIQWLLWLLGFSS